MPKEYPKELTDEILRVWAETGGAYKRAADEIIAGRGVKREVRDMSMSFVSESYRDPESKTERRRWVVNGNNSSHPDSPVTIMLHDEKMPGTSDGTREQMTIPFGVLAEIVGRRAQADKISKIQDLPPRHFLGLNDQGGYAVQD